MMAPGPNQDHICFVHKTQHLNRNITKHAELYLAIVCESDDVLITLSRQKYLFGYMWSSSLISSSKPSIFVVSYRCTHINLFIPVSSDLCDTQERKG